MAKISNKSLIFLTIVLLIAVIVVATLLKITEIHDERLIYAMESKISYYAKRCYLEGNCDGDVTLADLYDRGYLEEIVNPVTKEIISKDTIISYNDNEISIDYGV